MIDETKKKRAHRCIHELKTALDRKDPFQYMRVHNIQKYIEYLEGLVEPCETTDSDVYTTEEDVKRDIMYTENIYSKI